MRRLLTYALLAIGGIIFAWPFIWMAATSAKLDREMFGARPRTLPQRPIPRVKSPYVDDRLFADVTGPRLEDSLTIIESHLTSQPFLWPQTADLPRLRKETARGVYARLLTILPGERWEDLPDQLRTALAAAITPQLVTEVVQQLQRSLGIGQLRARSFDIREDQLVAPENAATAWQIGGDAFAQLRQSASSNEPFAELHYDFSRGATVTLSQTFTTSFPVERLRRLQLYLRPDDTWHTVQLRVEKLGRVFTAERPFSLADYNWTVITWQEPGPEDTLTKIKTWILLKPDKISRADVAGIVTDPNQIKVTVELRKSGLPGAWWAKIWRNYRLTLDYIPFWRYVATSLFLIILNVGGTLLSCSLAAYAFARLQWPGRGISFALLLATMMIPPQVTMIPQFLIMQKLGWYNTLTPLWIMSFFAPAFYVFLLHQFLKGIPRDLEDAARLDGCGFLRIYWHIMLPLVKPTLAAIGIFTFLATWNEFMGPLIYLSDQRLYPLSFGLYAFQIQALQPGTAAGMGMIMAGALLMTLPVIVIFFFAQRYFLQGVTLTGMKG